MPLLSITKLYKDGDILSAADLDAICNSMETFLNGTNLDSVNFQASLIDALAFPGMIVCHGSLTAPIGWLSCDGTAVSRTTYAGLFNVIGTSFGVGDGSTTFNLPNFKRYVPIGTHYSADIGSTQGEETHTLTVAEMPAHTHTATGSHTHTMGGLTFSAGSFTGATVESRSTLSRTPSNDLTALATSTLDNTGGGGAHNNVQPSLVVNFIIKT